MCYILNAFLQRTKSKFKVRKNNKQIAMEQEKGTRLCEGQ